MNILALTSAYPQPDDGKEVVTPTVKYFCDKWVELGHRVIVIHSNSCFPAFFYWIPEGMRQSLSSRLGHNLPTAESRRTLHRVENGVSIYRIPMVKVIPHGKFSQSKINKQLQNIEQILSNENFVPDMIIAHWVNPQIEFLPILGEKYHAKTSLVFHGDCSEQNIERFQLKENAKKLDAIGCRNNEYADHVKVALNLPQTPFICYSGIPDESACSQEKKLQSGMKFTWNREFIFVGRLVKYKNADVIIKALHTAYPDHSFKLHIVGEGAELESLKKLTAELGLTKNVIFHGQLPRADVFSMMQKCCCFIMVSNHETFGMVYIEAMLAGCVTIASKNGGVDGVIVNGENGFLSEEGDTAELTETLKKIEELEEPALTQIREKAVSTAIRYSDKNVAKKYIDDILLWKKF